MSTQASRSGEGQDGASDLPRTRGLTSWRVPLAFWVLGLACGIGFGVAGHEAAGEWIGGLLGFLTVVTLCLVARNRGRR